MNMRLCQVCGLLLACLLSMATGSDAQTTAPAEKTSSRAALMKPIHLPDGVMVQGGTSLKTIRATWMVLVTLQAPTYPEGLTELLDVIRDSYGHLRVRPLFKQAWKGRLDQMDIRLPHFTTGQPMGAVESPVIVPRKAIVPSRKKRGLINAVGSVMGFLFGTATQEEVEQYKVAIEQLQKKTGDLMHVTKDMMSVVDQTQAYMKKTEDAYLSLAKHVKNMDVFIERMRSNINNIDIRLHQVEARLEIEQAVREAERTYALYQRQQVHFMKQRGALERGRLSEEVMSPELLLQIVKYAAQQDKATVSSLMWLYQYVRVEPVVISGRELIYRLALPVLGRQDYLLFNINSMPVPISNSGMSVQIHLDQNYGVSTRTGHIFVAEGCYGHNPVTCPSKPLYKATVQQCARGLIFNQSDLISQCKFDLSKGNNDTKVKQTAPDRYLITTWFTLLKLRCPSEIELAMKLRPGTYALQCASGCVIEGDTFQIECPDTFHLKRFIKMPTIHVHGQFNFSNTLRAPDLLKAFPTLKDMPTGTIPAVSSDLIHRAMALSDDHWAKIKRHTPLLSLILTILFVTLLLILGAGYIYYARGAKWGWGCLSRRRRPQSTREVRYLPPLEVSDDMEARNEPTAV